MDNELELEMRELLDTLTTEQIKGLLATIKDWNGEIEELLPAVL